MVPLVTQPTGRPSLNTPEPARATPLPVTATALVIRGRSAHEPVVAGQEPSVGGVLPEERRPTHELTLDRGEAHGEGRQGGRHDGDLAAFRIGAQFVAVERQGRFQAQRVPGSQPGGSGAGLDQNPPELRRVLGVHEELEAERLARVARAADQHARAGHPGHAQLVAAGLGQASPFEQAEKDVPRGGPLERQHGQRFRAVLDVEARQAVAVGRSPAPPADCSRK